MDVSKIVQSLVNKCIIEFKKENLDKIHQDVIDQLFFTRYKNYIHISYYHQ